MYGFFLINFKSLMFFLRSQLRSVLIIFFAINFIFFCNRKYISKISLKTYLGIRKYTINRIYNRDVIECFNFKK